MTDVRAVLAADIGATAMRAAVVDATGRILARRRVPALPERGIEDAAARLALALAEVRDEAGAPVAHAGVASAGPIDPATGEYRHPPNLPGWHGRSMRTALAIDLGVPVTLGHDATLAAIAETRFGHRAGASDLVYLTVSSGIGAGIVSGGRPVTGSTGGAGEAGHLLVNPGGAPCGAGCPGCLEGAASGLAIARAARELIEAGEATTLSLDATAEDVFAAARVGDGVALAVIGAAIRHLATGLASLLALLDPEAIVLGGGVAEGLRPYWDRLLAETAQRALPRYATGVPVEMTTLGDDASLLGAAAVALDAAERPRSS